MLARTTRNPLKKMSHVNKGIGLMDKAIKLDPDNISVRLVRGLNSSRLPGFLNRGEVAIEDFEHLASLIPQRPHLPQSTRKLIYTHLADLYRQVDETAKADQVQQLADALH